MLVRVYSKVMMQSENDGRPAVSMLGGSLSCCARCAVQQHRSNMTQHMYHLKACEQSSRTYA